MNEPDLNRPAPQSLTTDDFLPEPPSPLVLGHSRRGIVICAGLFVLTCITTFFNGMMYGERTPTTTSADLLWYGLSYAGPLMLILTAHEMGHYLMARWYGVPATLPIFIPLPPGVGLFGTMGAVIVQQAGMAHRKATFDIGIAGPLAGLVFALPVAWFGIQQSRVVEFRPDQFSTTFGDPLILKAMVWATFGSLPPHHDVVLNPLLYAGWVGVFLTGLNLVPVSQLDGGHVLYTLVGKRAHLFSYIVLAAGAAYMAYFSYWLYAPMLVLLALIGLKHPPTTNDEMPLGLVRQVLGWFTLLVILVTCFTPFPFTVNEPQVPPSQMQPLPAGENDLTVHRAVPHSMTVSG
jgi:membrane-associated protease RseP (regulator of RpoE activity)